MTNATPQIISSWPLRPNKAVRRCELRSRPVLAPRNTEAVRRGGPGALDLDSVYRATTFRVGLVLASVLATWGAGAVTTVQAQRASATPKSFDAVGGGPASAMSFASSGGCAMRFYPPGAQSGYAAGTNFQSYSTSALFRRLEGMEGSIWGQNVWASQKHAKKGRDKAQRQNRPAAQPAPVVVGATRASRATRQQHDVREVAGSTDGLRSDKRGAASRPAALSRPAAAAAEAGPYRGPWPVHARREQRLKTAEASQESAARSVALDGESPDWWQR